MAVDPPIPLRDFFRNPQQALFTVSPLGTAIAFVQPFENRLNVFVQAREGGPVTRVTSETERDIAGYVWKGDDRILFAKDFAGDENFHIVSVGRDGSGLRDLTPFDKVRAEIVDDLKDHPTDILIAMNRRNPELFDIHRLNVVTGALAPVAENPGNIVDWLTDHTGAVRVAMASDGVNRTLLYRETESAEFQPVLTTNFREMVMPALFTFDDARVYAISNRGRDKSALVVLDPRTGREDEVLYEHPEVDISGVAFSRRRKVLTSVAFETDKPGRHCFDEQTRSLYDKLERRFPGYRVDITSGSDDEKTLIVATWSDRTRGSRYLYDVDADELRKLADVSPWLDEERMAAMTPIVFAARDGLAIHGYLTVPRGAATNLPMIVLPHGGPWARDHWDFHPEVQFLASRGYAVLQINFRGSTGYGRAFLEASFKQWGKTMQDDISDGVHYAIASGVADPKRIAIYGASYGGYATLAGLTFTPELYACGVDYVGVANLFTFMNTIPPYWKPELDRLHEMVGHPERDAELLRAASPVFHVERIRAPLFVAQGRHDPRVNIAESDQIVEALRARGVHVHYMVKDNEGHGFHNEENRFDFYTAMEAFLSEHLT